MSGRYSYSKQTQTDKHCYYPMQYVEYTPYADYFRKESRRLRSRIEDMSKTELLTEGDIRRSRLWYDTTPTSNEGKEWMAKLTESSAIQQSVFRLKHSAAGGRSRSP
jgi:hypothetical protein